MHGDLAPGLRAGGYPHVDEWTARAADVVLASAEMCRWLVAALGRGQTVSSWLASVVEMESYGLNWSKDFVRAVGRTDMIDSDKLASILLPEVLSTTCTTPKPSSEPSTKPA